MCLASPGARMAVDKKGGQRQSDCQIQASRGSVSWSGDRESEGRLSGRGCADASGRLSCCFVCLADCSQTEAQWQHTDQGPLVALRSLQSKLQLFLWFSYSRVLPLRACGGDVGLCVRFGFLLRGVFSGSDARLRPLPRRNSPFASGRRRCYALGALNTRRDWVGSSCTPRGGGIPHSH